MQIRPARSEDVAPLRELARAAYQVYVGRIGREPPPMNADFARLVATGVTWVAEDDGTVAGFVVLVPANDHLLIENVAVAPHLQGRGVGSELLHFADVRAAALGVSELRLYTNEAMTENIAYYPRRGFRETHRATTDGLSRVFFTKPLG